MGGIWSTPLTSVAFRGFHEIVVMLLEHGADTTAINNDTYGWTPMHLASMMGHAKVVRSLLDHGADLSAKHCDDGQPLHAAATHGHAETVRVLLDHGADVESKDRFGRTPEDYAATYSHPHVVAMLKAVEERREEVRRDTFEAFAMGQQERLGAGSLVRGLEEGLVQMVLEHL